MKSNVRSLDFRYSWAAAQRNTRLALLLLAVLRGDSAFCVEDEKVPLNLWEVHSGSSTSTDLREAGRSLGAQSIALQQLTFSRRFPVGQGPWYFGVGFQGEAFSFGGHNSSQVRDLRDIAGVLSLEYFVGTTPAAVLSIKPGFYFENQIRSDSLDAPIQLVSGLPMTPTLNGVIGVAAARFYHHPIPIVGLSWSIRPNLHLDAVFPEPALTYTVSKDLEFKLGGELQSGGFRTNSGTPLEYYSYQVKGRVSYSLLPTLKVSGALGCELERSFDYFQRGQHQTSEGAVLLELGAVWTF